LNYFDEGHNGYKLLCFGTINYGVGNRKQHRLKQFHGCISR
jgi:hypothetical protein